MRISKVSTCEQMVMWYLRSHGYEGLVSENGDCACEIDDLMPCGGDYIQDCKAGYKIPCNCGEGHKFHITTKKPFEDPKSEV